MSKPEARRYGVWAGNPKGVAEDLTRCIVKVHEPRRSILMYQCLRKRGFGPDGLYCKQHDPMTIQAKREKQNAAFQIRVDSAKLVAQDQRVGAWLRRYKPEDYKDIARLVNEQT